jgi:DNA-binding MarR family transcriptional regulator
MHNYGCVSSDDVALDLLAAVSLAGGAVDGYVLAGLRAQGLAGLTVGHGYVVQRLVPGPATASEIAAALGVSQQAASKTVGELLRLGYVRHVDDPADRRRRPVELSPSGRRALEAGRELRADLERRVTAAVGADGVTAARDVLLAVLDVLGVSGNVRRRAMPPPPASS